jgi:aspartokinase
MRGWAVGTIAFRRLCPSKEGVAMKKIKIGGIMHNANLSMLGVLAVPDQPGVAASVLNSLGDHSINVQFIVQCIDHAGNDHIVLCIDRSDLPTAKSLVQSIVPDLPAGTMVEHGRVAAVSIFGPDFRERPGIAGTMFGALADEDINILAISTSISTVSCIIESSRLESAVRILKSTFELP